MLLTIVLPYFPAKSLMYCAIITHVLHTGNLPPGAHLKSTVQIPALDISKGYKGKKGLSQDV
eukprot:scaffold154716_cov21-Tisochrysis_lutea.AAC.1